MRNDLSLSNAYALHLCSWESPDTITERVHLRRTIHVAPIPITIDRPGVPPVTTAYGTRLSTVILVKRNGEVTFIERDIWKMVDGKPKRLDKEEEKTQRIFKFRIGDN